LLHLFYNDRGGFLHHFDDGIRLLEGLFNLIIDLVNKISEFILSLEDSFLSLVDRFFGILDNGAEELISIPKGFEDVLLGVLGFLDTRRDGVVYEVKDVER